MIIMMVCSATALLSAYLLILILQLKAAPYILIQELVPWCWTLDIIALGVLIGLSIAGIIIKAKEVRRDKR